MARIMMVALVFAVVAVVGPTYVNADPTSSQKVLYYER